MPLSTKEKEVVIGCRSYLKHMASSWWLLPGIGHHCSHNCWVKSQCGFRVYVPDHPDDEHLSMHHMSFFGWRIFYSDLLLIFLLDCLIFVLVAILAELCEFSLFHKRIPCWEIVQNAKHSLCMWLQQLQHRFESPIPPIPPSNTRSLSWAQSQEESKSLIPQKIPSHRG